jgi:urease accessory protein
MTMALRCRPRASGGRGAPQPLASAEAFVFTGCPVFAGHDSRGMVVLAPNDSAQIFATNRATGRIVLHVEAQDGVTRRARVREEGSLRVRFPNASGALEAVIVNTGGGMTGGDRFGIDITVGEQARVVAATAAAEKIYRSTGPDAEMAVTLDIRAGGRLAWLPQETILFDRARLSRRIGIDLASGASLIMAEAAVFGRAAMGEAMQRGFFSDRWRLRRDGRLVFAESARLDGAIAEKLKNRAVAAGGVAIASVLLAPADEKTIAPLRALNAAGEIGISAWNGIALARLVARDGATLRRDLVALLTALGQSLPRLWLQ